MNKNKKKIVFVLCALMLVIGVSFAYYVMNIVFEGEGSSVAATTKQFGDVKVTYEGDLKFDDRDILPGHKNISEIKVMATGDNKKINYNLIWTGTNYLSTNLTYTIYKTDSKKSVSVSCEEKEEILIGEIRYHEECKITGDNLGEVVATGIIGDYYDNENPLKLKGNDSILATDSGKTVYYYVVIEFTNNPNENQYEELNGNAFEGEISIVQALPLNAYQTILANKEIQTRRDFNDTITETTTNVIYKNLEDHSIAMLKNSNNYKASFLANETETLLGKTYYFAGAPTDNYVKFAGFYWRIIRINENGSIRLLYSGKVSDVDAAGKNIVLANGYFDEQGLYSNIGLSYFSEQIDNNMYVGFKYEDGVQHGFKEKSTILEKVLEPWYKKNILDKGYERYIDMEAGFCGDRTAYLDNKGIMIGGGVDNLETIYGSYVRLDTLNAKPTLECPDERDFYTVSTASLGNKSLTYPIGLITADEVVFAGGSVSSENYDYYLSTGYFYWTMSPWQYYSPGFDPDEAELATVNPAGLINGDEGYHGSWYVRPVINLRADVTFDGQGNIDIPYEVSLSNSK